VKLGSTAAKAILHTKQFMSSVFEYFCYVTTAEVDASLFFPMRFYSFLAQPECVTADIYSEILARISKRMFEHFRLLACIFLGGYFPCHSFFKSYAQKKMVGKQDEL
jgi:hypothetical protein